MLAEAGHLRASLLSKGASMGKPGDVLTRCRKAMAASFPTVTTYGIKLGRTS